MISFRLPTHRFHLRAGAVATQGDHVLLHRLEGDRFWALPGGRVEAGEDAAQTLVREFREELGVDIVCHGLLAVGENFFEHGGEPHHELGLYFAVSLPAGSPLLAIGPVHAGREGERRLDFAWFARQALAGLDIRPAALREGLARGALPAHFVQRDTAAGAAAVPRGAR